MTKSKEGVEGHHWRGGEGEVEESVKPANRQDKEATVKANLNMNMAREGGWSEDAGVVDLERTPPRAIGRGEEKEGGGGAALRQGAGGGREGFVCGGSRIATRDAGQTHALECGLRVCVCVCLDVSVASPILRSGRYMSAARCNKHQAKNCARNAALTRRRKKGPSRRRSGGVHVAGQLRVALPERTIQRLWTPRTPHPLPMQGIHTHTHTTLRFTEC